MNQQLLITLRELRTDIKFVESMGNRIHGLCNHLSNVSLQCPTVECDTCIMNGELKYVDETLENICEPRIDRDIQ